MKVYEVATVVDNVNSFFSHPDSVITAVDGYEDVFLIGSNNGEIVELSVDTSRSEASARPSSAVQLCKASVSETQGIIQLQHCCHYTRLVVLVDTCIALLSLPDIQLILRLSVALPSCFAIRECSKDEKLLLAVGTHRKYISLLELCGGGFRTWREIDCDDVAQQLIYEENILIYGTTSFYYAYDITKNDTMQLVENRSFSGKAVMCKVAEKEYLFQYQNLGIFVTADGTSKKTPLRFDEETVEAIVCTSSNIVCMTLNHLLVYSLLDLKQKQLIPFAFGSALLLVNNRLVVSSHHQVYELKPVSWEKQVSELLKDKDADEALALAANVKPAAGDAAEHRQKVMQIQQHAAFLYLEAHRWVDASDLLIASQTDPREVISIYSGLLPTNTTFIKAVPSLHNIPSVSFITKDDEKVKVEFDRFLIAYVSKVRKRSYGKKFQYELDTALVKLLSKRDCSSLEKFLDDDNAFDEENCIAWCLEKKMLHAAALICWRAKNYDQAFSLWKKMVDSQTTDAEFDGLAQIYLRLIKCPNFTFLAKNSNWLIRQNSQLFLELLIESPTAKSVDFDSVVLLLEPSPDLLLRFLERSSGITKDEKVSNRLARVLIDRILSSEKSGNTQELLDLRKRCRSFLLSSSYNADYVLDLLNHGGIQLGYEKAIVLAKMKKYREAVEIILEVEGCTAAEEFCTTFFHRSKSAQESLQASLLELYLNPKMDRAVVTPRILNILNSLETDACLEKVLRLLPDDWPVATMRRMILRSMQALENNIIRSHNTRNVTQRLNINHSRSRMELTRKPICLSDTSTCSKCGGLLGGSGFKVIAGSGPPVHVRCPLEDRSQ